MGQDREYTGEEIQLALRTVRDYRDRWAQVEKDNLEADINQRLRAMNYDREYKEHFEYMDVQEIERLVEEAMA